MNTDNRPIILQDIVSQAKARGFTHVMTYGGPMPLDTWEPYGILRADGTRGINNQMATWSHIPPLFQWIDDSRVRDGAGLPAPEWPLRGGIWEFVTR